MEVENPKKPDQSLTTLSSATHYQRVVQEILVQLRGSKTQRAFSQELGYTFNQVGKWESGATKLKWLDFVDLCKKIDLPLLDHCVFYFSRNYDEFSIENIAQHVLESYGKVDLGHAKLVQRLERWSSGKVQMNLQDFLEALDSYPSSMFAWLSLFLDCENIPTIQDEYQNFVKCMEAVADNPTLIFINAALNVLHYQNLDQHDERVLARHACMQPKDLRDGLQKMVDLRIIKFDGRKYYPSPFDFSFSNLRHKRLRKFHKYSTMLAGLGYSLEPFAPKEYEQTNDSRTSTRVNAVSQDAAIKITELISQFHNDVTDVIQSDRGNKNNVQMIVLHSVASTLIDAKNSEESLNACLPPLTPGAPASS